MKNQRIHSDLSDYLSLNQFAKAKRLLENYPDDIDIIYKDGIFFRFAISEDNVGMFNTLLEYFEKTQLQGDSERLEYKVAKHKLQEILKDAVDTFNISEEMEAVLNRYIPKQDVDLEQELDSIEDLMGFNFPKMETDRGGDHNENNDPNLDFMGKDSNSIDSD